MNDTGGEKVILTLLNGTGYIFDADDYLKLRQEHRIIGSLVGTCGNRGWSANESMLPVELSKWETQLLVERGIAWLVSKKESLLGKPTANELALYKEDFEQRIVEQAETLKAEKLREAERNMPKIIKGKRKKLLASGVPEEAIHLDPESVLKEIGDRIVFDRKNALLQIHCAHPVTHKAKIIRQPATVKSLKYDVFRDLWLKHKFITSGESFGADFLIYPGDPLLYHASHMIILLEEPRMSPLLMIAKVRLAVTVNKICVFAYYGTNNNNKSNKCSSTEIEEIETVEGTPEIKYQTVSWEGNFRKVE